MKLVESSRERDPPLGGMERRRMAGYREATPSLLDKQITRVLEKVAWHSLTHGCLLIAAYRKREKKKKKKEEKGWLQRGDVAKVKGEQRGAHFESSKRQGAEVEGSGESLARD